MFLRLIVSDSHDINTHNNNEDHIKCENARCFAISQWTQNIL